MDNTFIHSTSMGPVKGLSLKNQFQFLGIHYATAGRFEYANPVNTWDGGLDATSFGPACIQKRCYYPHLEVPERMFYHKEFRENIHFDYSEDCLNLNIYTPDLHGKAPVVIFIHGGGFDSGANYDSAITGTAYPAKEIVFVSINYRVGIFGYFTHEEIFNEYGREGNFGLDDQVVAIRWIKDHISEFGGDPDNITLMGQSAGAISIQYLCLSEKCKGLFQHAIMLSGAGLFPKFSLPRNAASTREYWLDLASILGVTSLSEFKAIDPKTILNGLEILKARRKDNTYNTMPVIDGYLLSAPIDKLIKSPFNIDYMVGCTNNDMYAILMEMIGAKYSSQTGAYFYYFDIDAPGEDDNAAFHSSDLRYVFGTLTDSHRPYDIEDFNVSDLMLSYIANFARSGNPNGEGLPPWKPGKKPLHIVKPCKAVTQAKPDKLTLLRNTLTKGDPK